MHLFMSCWQSRVITSSIQLLTGQINIFQIAAFKCDAVICRNICSMFCVFAGNGRQQIVGKSPLFGKPSIIAGITKIIHHDLLGILNHIIPVLSIVGDAGLLQQSIVR